MNLHQSKRILLGMKSLGGVQYLDGGYMPIADRAPYLGTNMSAKGNPRFEIRTRITNTTTTLNKLDLFWKKAPVPTTWKLRVHGAVVSSKLLYGLESASLTHAEYDVILISNKGPKGNVGDKTFIPFTHKRRSCDAKSQPEDKTEGGQNNYEDVRTTYISRQSSWLIY